MCFQTTEAGRTVDAKRQNKIRTHPDRLPHAFLLHNEDQPHRFNCSRIDRNFSRGLRRHHGDDNHDADARRKLDVRPLRRTAASRRRFLQLQVGSKGLMRLVKAQTLFYFVQFGRPNRFLVDRLFLEPDGGVEVSSLGV